MKLSGSLLASGAALSLWWAMPAGANERPAVFQPGSAALAPRVIAPSSAVFSRSDSPSSGAGVQALPRARHYRDRWAAGNVGRIRRTPVPERAGVVAPVPFIPQRNAAGFPALARPGSAASPALSPMSRR